MTEPRALSTIRYGEVRRFLAKVRKSISHDPGKLTEFGGVVVTADRLAHEETCYDPYDKIPSTAEISHELYSRIISMASNLQEPCTKEPAA